MICFLLDLRSHGSDPWSFLVFLMGYPWAHMLMFVAAWSIAHSSYPIDLYFIPCALLNVVAVYWIAKNGIRRPNQ